MGKYALRSDPMEGPEYDIYPRDLEDPYRARRGKVPGDRYALVGIERDDHTARAKQMALNFSFFGAPVGMFISIDRKILINASSRHDDRRSPSNPQE